jgi:hypothetical protein
MTDNLENRFRELLRRLNGKVEAISEDVLEIRTTPPIDFAEVGRVRLNFNDRGQPRAIPVRLYALVKDHTR